MRIPALARRTILGCLSAIVLAGPAEAQNAIHSIAYEGAGCPQGSIASSLSADRTMFTLIFDSYIASAGAVIPETEAAKDCVIVVQLQTSEEALATIDVRGYVQLDAAGISATSVSHVPRARKSRSVESFTGPSSRDYLNSSKVTMVPLGSTSNSRFVIMTSLEIDNSGNPAGEARITIDTIDVKLEAVPVP